MSATATVAPVATVSNGSVPSDPISTEDRIVTPEEATDLLRRNTRNRRLRPALVGKLAGAMRRGEWRFNGDSIRISEDDELLDGQHRLAAVAETGIPQRFLVVTGLPSETQETMDAGAKRTMADTLKLRGEQNVNRLAAALRLVFLYETQDSFRPPNISPTTQELLACFERNPGVAEAVSGINPVIANTYLASGPVSACAHLFRRVDVADAEVFFTRLAQGTELTPEDPIYLLRRMFAQRRPAGSRIPPYIQGALLIKAWNLWRRGEGARLLAFRPGGSTPERFPLVEGLELEV
jgi:hypothetical protein